MSGALDTLARRIQDAKRLTILTGAGSFCGERCPDVQGTRRIVAPLSRRGSRDAGGVCEQSSLVWEWYAWRREMILALSSQPGARRHRCMVAQARVPGAHAER